MPSTPGSTATSDTPGSKAGCRLLGGDINELHAAAEAALEASVREALPESDVEIEQRAIQGVPAGVLVDESRDADLLVVGSRGHGGFAQLCWARSASNAPTMPSARS